MKHPKAGVHGTIDEVFDDIWFVKGTLKMPMLLPVNLSRSMVVLRHGDELTLVNSMRLSEDGLARLDKLGKVTNVIRLGGFHGRDDGFYRERDGAKIYAIQGQFYARGIGGKAPKENYLEPDVWLNDSSQLPIAGAKLLVMSTSKPAEGALLLDRDGGILITADCLQHTPAADEYHNFGAKMMMKKMGFFKPHAIGAGWLEFAKPEAADVRNLLSLSFDHVLPGHGDPVIGGAFDKYAPQLRAPMVGCKGYALK